MLRFYFILFFIFIYLFIFFQEAVKLLGHVKIHVRRTESVNRVLPIYVRI